MSHSEEMLEEYEEGESKPRHKTVYIPHMAPPKLPEGEIVDFDDLHRKRQEKDLTDLETLIQLHFSTRQKEEDELEELRSRMERRRTERAEQQRLRAEQERQRHARLAEEKSRREEEAARLRADEEAKKKKIFSSKSFGGYLQKVEQKKGKKLTAREEKKKVLMERRKPLSIEHLNHDKLAEKAQDLWLSLQNLHADKFHMAEMLRKQKYQIHVLRNRVSDHQRGSKMSKMSRGRSTSRK